MLHVLPRLKQRDVKLGILMDGDRVVFSIRAGDQSQLAPLLFCRKLLLLIARLDAAVLGQNPNLEQMGRIRLGGIRLTVANPGARAHTLSILPGSSYVLRPAMCGSQPPIHCIHGRSRSMPLPGSSRATISPAFSNMSSRTRFWLSWDTA